MSATCYNVALMPIDDEVASEAIFSARSSGRGIVAIAREFGRSEDEVRSTIAEMVARTYDGAQMREAIALENHRLLALALKYYALAMDRADHQAAVIYVKTSERRMSMLGGNAPAQYSVHLSHAVAVAPTSTERLRAALDRLDAKASSPAAEEQPSGPH
jgi:hypothetical protein